MNDARLRELRRDVRAGQLPDDLFAELRAVAANLVRRRALPPSFAPYGQWDEEAAEEIFSNWYADRLLGRGHLLALLDQAATADALRALAHRSLRQHLLNAADRSQAYNLFRRNVALLDGDDAFVPVGDASRPQDRWYALRAAADPQNPWAGPDRELIAHGWAIGDITVIRYRAAAAKLSPILDTAALKRFAAELMARTGHALTPAHIMRALSHRFDLSDVAPEALDSGNDAAPAGPASPPADTAVLLRAAAQFVLDALTPRQRQVAARSGTETVATLAEELGCSAGTIVNEQRRVAALVEHVTEDDEERDTVLNIVADLLYFQSDG